MLRGKENRSWLWGPSAFAAADEPYKQGTQGKREVLYFDKARMEVNNPSADPTSPTYVTNGLLVVEMVSGRIQTGDNQFEPPRAPSQAVIAGDSNSSDAITYASLAPVASLNGDKQAPDKTGRSTAEVLDRSGQVRLDQGRQPVKLVRFEPATGHNIADVFWTFMNSSGPIFNDRFNTHSNGAILNWVSDLGYPITDPYWTNVVIGGSGKWVLIQAFQRRVLTYVPDNQPGWQVEMGNVGRHYYDWRYLGK